MSDSGFSETGRVQNAHEATRIGRAVAALLLVGAGANLVWLVAVSRRLRPSADDYWFGAVVAEHGVIGGVAHWWATWSAYPVQLLLGNLLVGAPLVYLPVRLISAVPYLVALVLTGVVAERLLDLRAVSRRTRVAVALGAGWLWVLYGLSLIHI